MIRTVLLWGALAGAAAFWIAAEVIPDVAQAAEGTLAKQDRDFMHEATMGGMLEVKLGELAQDHAASDEVKKFGQRMVEDHARLNQKLAELATQRGITLPDKLDKKAQTTFDELSKLHGATFDKTYMADMVGDHEHDVAGFEKEAKAAKDPDLAALITSALPTLHEHLALAKQVRAVVEK